MRQLIKKWKLRGLIYLLVCVFSIFVIYDRFVNAQIVNAEKLANNCRPQFVVELGAVTKPISEADPCQEKLILSYLYGN